MSELEMMIKEVRSAILLMCDDMDSSNDPLEKEIIRRVILLEKDRLRDLIALHEKMTNKPE